MTETCALCGHTDHATWATVTIPLPANAAGSTHIVLSLCHEDNHSCYHQWTVYGKRPVTDRAPLPEMKGQREVTGND